MHACAVQWSYQGVLLLNAVLTVRAHTPASHGKKGWETLTDAAIKVLSAKRKGLVFLLWGKFAQQKAALIDAKKHHILTAAHPSGFSANKVGALIRMEHSAGIAFFMSFRETYSIYAAGILWMSALLEGQRSAAEGRAASH